MTMRKPASLPDRAGLAGWRVGKLAGWRVDVVARGTRQLRPAIGGLASWRTGELAGVKRRSHSPTRQLANPPERGELARWREDVQVRQVAQQVGHVPQLISKAS